MFENLSYLGYTLIFTIPPIALLWLRREFFEILIKNLKSITLSAFILTFYGSIVWSIGISMGTWSYGGDKILNIKLFNFVFIEDVIWWFLISFLFASFITVSAHYEDRKLDIVSQEIKGLVVSLKNALCGFRAITLERNLTIHVAITILVLIGGVLFKISTLEWIIVTIVIAMVVGFELLNSALERLAEKYTTQHDEDVRFIKDVAAGGVLVASGAAIIIGIVIFLPRFLAVIL